MSIKSILCAISTCSFITFTSINNVYAVDYQIIDLGTLGGTYSSGESINKDGQVTGKSQISGDSANHAFLYDSNSMQSLGLLAPTDVNSYGNGINDNGQITGYSADIDYYGNDTAYQAFIYDLGSMQNLNALLPTTCNLRSKAYDINNSGQVTGYCAYYVDNIWDTEEVHAFFYDGSTMHELSILGNNSKGYAINNNGHITGYTRLPYPDFHAFIYNGTSIRDLGTLGGQHSHGVDINDSGQVTGGSWITGDDDYHAFFYDGNKMHDLGTLGGENSEGEGINSSGHVVGRSQLTGGEYIAFLYADNRMLDLCVLTNCTTNGWSSLTFAKSINDRGDITGSGIINNETHAFVILAGDLPPPPPSAAPVAINDVVNVDIDTAKDINVIANDTDAEDGSPPTAPPAFVTPTTATSTNGFVITANANGSITYRPTDGFTGTDDFKYTLTDSDDQVSTPATVNITVTADPIFTAPVAKNDNVIVKVDTAKDINVIANDADAEDGSPPAAPPAFVTPTTTTSKKGFAISVNTNGTITYTPTGGFTGADDFKYTLTDSDDQVSTPATVKITVSADPVFTAPVANNDNVSVKVNTAKDINVILNDIDVEDGSPPLAPPAFVTPTTATSTQGFSLLANPNGTITYTPTGGFTGADNFQYILTDSDGVISLPATVNIVVSADSTFEAPVANDDDVSVIVDRSKDINVIANDTDFEDGSPPLAPPAFIVLTSPTSSQGFVLSVNTNGTITYTPTGGFTGTDNFTYTLTDSDGEVSVPATVNITVTADSVSATPGTNSGNSSGLAFNFFYLMVIVGWIAIGRYKSMIKWN